MPSRRPSCSMAPQVNTHPLEGLPTEVVQLKKKAFPRSGESCYLLLNFVTDF